MRTTRRRLLSMVGLGAAAVAVGGAVEPARAEEKGSRSAAMFDSRVLFSVDKNGVHIGDVRDDAEREVVSDAVNDMLAQARADGYNRGRLVEEAAWEASWAKNITAKADAMKRVFAERNAVPRFLDD